MLTEHAVIVKLSTLGFSTSTSEHSPVKLTKKHNTKHRNILLSFQGYLDCFLREWLKENIYKRPCRGFIKS